MPCVIFMNEMYSTCFNYIYLYIVYQNLHLPFILSFARTEKKTSYFDKSSTEKETAFVKDQLKNVKNWYTYTYKEDYSLFSPLKMVYDVRKIDQGDPILGQARVWDVLGI